MKSFTSKVVDKREDIVFELDGDKFYFTPVKQTTQLIGMLNVRGDSAEADIERIGSMLDWLAAGLDRKYYKAYQKDSSVKPGPDSQWGKLLDKLADPDDPLELDTLSDVITWLMGEVSGRPTT